MNHNFKSEKDLMNQIQFDFIVIIYFSYQPEEIFSQFSIRLVSFENLFRFYVGSIAND